MASRIEELRQHVRPPKGEVALAWVDAAGATSIDALGRLRDGLFEIGSLAKTMTGTLLASLVLDRAVSLDTTAGSILGSTAGRASDITLRELATHTSGLPRLAPNARAMPFYPRDPYRFYGRRRLVQGLSEVILEGRGEFRYSNMGYVLLGRCIEAAMRQDFRALVHELVFQPLGMVSARAQPCSRRRLLRGYPSMFLLGGRRWHEPLPGAGGIDASIDDLARWLRANVHPSTSSLEPAIRLAQTPHARADKHDVGLGWLVSGDRVRHNGATGRFHTSIAIRAGHMGIVGAATTSPSPEFSLDGPLIAWLEDHER